MKNITLLLLLLFCFLQGLHSQDCFIYAKKDKKMYFYENQKAMYIAFKRNHCPSGFVLPKARV